MTGAELIAKERQRQIEEEGWTAEHDNEHNEWDLAWAGACYVLDLVGWSIETSEASYNAFDDYWPWGFKDWKPTPNDPIRQLVKAGALIAAEIDKLQRQKG